MDITYEEWMSQTKKRFHKRSSELKRVDQAFKKFQDMKGKGSSLQDLARCFKLWIGLKGGDHLSSIRNRKVDASGQGPVERLQSLIRNHQLSNVAVVRTLQAEVPNKLVMDASLSSKLGDKSKVTETYNRSKMAVRAVHQAMLKAKSAGNERDLYERWFGAYDAGRLRTVIKNYSNLLNLFNSGVIIIHDARDLAGVWGDCYGFAMPGSKKNYVEFTVGRAFFQKTGYSVVPGASPQQRNQAVRQALAQAYKNTSDWTVGTMIHELGHAINNLPDIDFQAPNTFQESPGGMTPDGWQQCSTPDLDQDLANESPALAVRNTDNYGQCAREALQASGR